MKIRRTILSFFCVLISTVGSPGIAETHKVIVIDPGHGGHADSGSRALDQYNLSEWDHAKVAELGLIEGKLTLELSKVIAAAIARKHTANGEAVRAVLTRTDDVNPNFTERIATAAEAGANMFVSIHLNAGGKTANGPVVVYQKQQNNPSYETERSLAAQLVDAVRTVTARFDPTPNAVHFDDSDEHFTNKKKPYGSYLFYQARQNPKTRNIPVIYLEVEFLATPRLDRIKKLFVDQKSEVFSAWANAIAEVLVGRVAK